MAREQNQAIIESRRSPTSLINNNNNNNNHNHNHNHNHNNHHQQQQQPQPQQQEQEQEQQQQQQQQPQPQPQPQQPQQQQQQQQQHNNHNNHNNNHNNKHNHNHNHNHNNHHQQQQQPQPQQQEQEQEQQQQQQAGFHAQKNNMKQAIPCEVPSHATLISSSHRIQGATCRISFHIWWWNTGFEKMSCQFPWNPRPRSCERLERPRRDLKKSSRRWEKVGSGFLTKWYPLVN